MNNSTRLALTALLTSSLILGCSSDDSNDPGPTPNSNGSTANALNASNAAGDLMRVAQLTAGPSFARGVVGLDELGDMLDEVGDSMDSAACVSGVLVDDTSVRLSFDNCSLDGDLIDGDVNLNITVKNGAVVVEFVGALEIDGCGFDGSWSISVGAVSIDFSADVDLTHGGAAVGHASMTASWSWSAANLCPTIDMAIVLTDGTDSVEVAIDNLDACYGMCAAGASVTVTANGIVVSGEPGAEAVIIGDGDDALILSCDGDGDILIDGDGGNGDGGNGDGGNGDGGNGDGGNGDVSPLTGRWGYAAYTPVYGNCDVGDYFTSPGNFELHNHGDGTFTVYPGDGSPDLLCAMDSADYSCESGAQGEAPLTMTYTASGTFSSNDRGSGTRDVTVTCSGVECPTIELLTGASFPCTFEVQYQVARIGSL